MTETTKNSQPSQTDGTSTPAQDWQELPPDVYKALMYLEMRKLRHKHPHV